MPNPTLILFKALLCFAVAAALFHYADQAGTVRVTLIAEGKVRSVAVEPDYPTYREEVERARKVTMWMYIGSGLFACIGLYMVRTSVRVARKQREARALHGP